jgi:hypothetical protein
MAMKDPGPPGIPGTPLQHIQIVKGWVDDSGTAQEKVFDVVGDPDNGASVDTTTCTAQGSGADSLCKVWKDPDFDRSQRAFYYARVLENPTCRWSTYVCNRNGVDCSNPGSVPPGFAACCNPLWPKSIQERAWTSPIWYRPEGIARLRGRVQFGATAGNDVLRLFAKIGANATGWDPDNDDITVAVSDDDEIYRVTIPAGSFQQVGKVLRYKDPTGSLNGLERASIRVKSNGETILAMRTAPIDLSNADRSEHMVHVQIDIGSYRTTHHRLWQARGNRLIVVKR